MEFNPTRRLTILGIASAALLLGTRSILAAPWDNAPEHVKKWMREQENENGESCCGLGDAPPVKVGETNGQYYFEWEGQLWPIPLEVIDWVESTPVNRHVIFFRYYPEASGFGVTYTKASVDVYCAKLISPQG